MEAWAEVPSGDAACCGDVAEADGNAVPCVHQPDDEGELDHFLGGKMLRHIRVNIVGNMRLSYERHGFGPGERSLFPGIEERDLPPHREAIEALLIFPELAGFGRVEVHAVGAAVDLRHTQFHEGFEFSIGKRGLELRADSGEAVDQGG